ncbi:MAG: EamA family transporter [Alphaproteobacteria bacterium]|nr:EamA family transporter [Alphaproteobacteria bacterium]
MDPFVFVTVLFAAACHAGWNASIKRTLDPLATTVLIAIGAGLVALPAIPFLGWPDAAGWPWLIASIVIHLFYFAGLIESYRTGDLGQVYPIARGAAPLMTASMTTALVGERLGIYGWGGIVMLALGVLLLSMRGGRGLKLDRVAVGFALFTAVTVCAYSVVDGIGARASGPGHATAYSTILFAGIAPVVVAYALYRRGTPVLKQMAPFWRIGLFGGGLAVTSYSIAIWAMTVAPIAIVAALRETSVLFGAIIAVVILKEPLRPARIVAALMIVCGLLLLRVA